MHPDELSLLLIEDNLAEAELLYELLVDLQTTNCDIVHYSRLADGLGSLKSRSFDIVLLDLSLPDSQGLGSLTTLMAEAPNTPIVVLTNTNDSEIAVEAVHKGAQDYLVKKNISLDQELLWRSILYAIERKKNQEALRTANELLRQEVAMRELMQQKLRHSNQELEQFAYVASHDMKQPLASIYSWSQLLDVRYGDRLEEKGHSYIHSIQNSVKQMTQLIEDLLTYSRVDQAESTFVEVNCHLIAHQVINRLDSAIASKKAQITTNSLPSIYGNPLQLGQLFQNLIENALKYSKPHRPPLIHLSATRNPEALNQWIFSCQDNGIGIENEYFDQIFFAFKRLHSQAEYTGTGIGLALCKKIVQRHGGKIWLESTYGEGSIFYFSLPTIPNTAAVPHHLHQKDQHNR
ncbi:MAG: response regulator [Limnothrix sp. RL_2_0]|nr:response regulator [Limnothrix sp. RL_2_0]